MSRDLVPDFDAEPREGQALEEEHEGANLSSQAFEFARNDARGPCIRCA